MQRKFTFRSSGRADVSLLRSGALVVFNVIATDVVVNVVDGAGYPYALGKVIATVATTVWNFLLYKHWIFKSPSREAAVAPARDGTAAAVPDPCPRTDRRQRRTPPLTVRALTGTGPAARRSGQ